MQTSSPLIVSVPEQYYLVVEKQITLEVEKPDDLPGALLGAFFVYNISYPSNLKPLFLVLESALLGQCSEKMPSRLKVVMNNLLHV